MNALPEAVLDASAVLAMLYEEAGGEKVVPYLSRGRISSVNLSEVAANMGLVGAATDAVKHVLTALFPKPDAFDTVQAYRAAALASETKIHGLSFGGRACIALGISHGLPVLTADRAWAKLKLPGLKIILVR